MSHVKSIQDRNKANVRNVLRLTGMSIEDYVNYQMEVAHQYLENMLGDDPMGIDYVYKSGLFWKWFISQWQKRDADGFVKSLYLVDRDQRLQKYKLMHLNWCVLRHQRPQMPQQVLNDMYFKRIGNTAKITLVCA